MRDNTRTGLRALPSARVTLAASPCMTPEVPASAGRSWSQVAAGFVVCMLAAVAFHGAWLLPIGTLGTPEAGFVPLVEALLLAAAGAVLLASARMRTTDPAIDWPRGEARRMVVHLAVGLFGYVLLLAPLGFTAATFLFIAMSVSAWRKYVWWVVAAYALAIAIALHLLFRVALRMSLPPGWWSS